MDMPMKGLMQNKTIALMGVILFAIALGAEDKTPVSTPPPAAKLSAESKAAIAVANTKLLNARLMEAERKQQVQTRAQQAVDEITKTRQAAETEYQATLAKVLDPLGLKGCTVTEEAEIGECPPKEAKGAATKPATK